MRRSANPGVRVALLAACTWAGGLTSVSAASGCQNQNPEPKNVTQEQRAKDPDKPPSDGPFSNPKKEPPGPREGSPPAPDELEKLLAQAREHVKAGRSMQAATVLHKCANKIPPSVACEAELGIVLAERKSHRAHARYYIAEAANVDDPAVDVETYRRLAGVARGRGLFDAAAAAWSIVTTREGASAEDFAAMAAALVADSSRRDEAIAAYGRAYELDGTRFEDLRKRAVLLAQSQRDAEALAAFEEYLDKAGAHSPHKAGIENRVAELRAKKKDQGKK